MGLLKSAVTKTGPGNEDTKRQETKPPLPAEAGLKERITGAQAERSAVEPGKGQTSASVFYPPAVMLQASAEGKGPASSSFVVSYESESLTVGARKLGKKATDEFARDVLAGMTEAAQILLERAGISRKELQVAMADILSSDAGKTLLADCREKHDLSEMMVITRVPVTGVIESKTVFIDPKEHADFCEFNFAFNKPGTMRLFGPYSVHYDGNDFEIVDDKGNRGIMNPVCQLNNLVLHTWILNHEQPSAITLSLFGNSLAMNEAAKDYANHRGEFTPEEKKVSPVDMETIVTAVMSRLMPEMASTVKNEVGEASKQFSASQKPLDMEAVIAEAMKRLEPGMRKAVDEKVEALRTELTERVQGLLDSIKGAVIGHDETLHGPEDDSKPGLLQRFEELAAIISTAFGPEALGSARFSREQDEAAMRHTIAGLLAADNFDITIFRSKADSYGREKILGIVKSLANEATATKELAQLYEVKPEEVDRKVMETVMSHARTYLEHAGEK